MVKNSNQSVKKILSWDILRRALFNQSAIFEMVNSGKQSSCKVWCVDLDQRLLPMGVQPVEIGKVTNQNLYGAQNAYLMLRVLGSRCPDDL